MLRYQFSGKLLVKIIKNHCIVIKSFEAINIYNRVYIKSILSTETALYSRFRGVGKRRRKKKRISRKF